MKLLFLLLQFFFGDGKPKNNKLVTCFKENIAGFILLLICTIWVFFFSYLIWFYNNGGV